MKDFWVFEAQPGIQAQVLAQLLGRVEVLRSSPQVGEPWGIGKTELSVSQVLRLAEIENNAIPDHEILILI